jgi:hypothetical protein
LAKDLQDRRDQFNEDWKQVAMESNRSLDTLRAARKAASPPPPLAKHPRAPIIRQKAPVIQIRSSNSSSLLGGDVEEESPAR